MYCQPHYENSRALPQSWCRWHNERSFSRFSGRCTRSDTAMTGEITLRGLVLPVGVTQSPRVPACVLRECVVCMCVCVCVCTYACACASVCARALRMICLEKLCQAIFSNVSYIFQGVFFKFLRHKQFFSSELIVRDFLVTLVNAFSLSP